jgi:hypothetical protein
MLLAGKGFWGLTCEIAGVFEDEVAALDYVTFLQHISWLDGKKGRAMTARPALQQGFGCLGGGLFWFSL